MKSRTHNHVTVSPTSITKLPSLHGKIPNEWKQTLQNTTHLTRSNQSVLVLLTGTSFCLPFPLGDYTAERERAVPCAHNLVTGISFLADLWSFLKSHSHELRFWNWALFSSSAHNYSKDLWFTKGENWKGGFWKTHWCGNWDPPLLFISVNLTCP